MNPGYYHRKQKEKNKQIKQQQQQNKQKSFLAVQLPACQLHYIQQLEILVTALPITANSYICLFFLSASLIGIIIIINIIIIISLISLL